MSINRVILIGNLARDPESRFTPSGVQVVNTAIAVQRITKNAETGDYEVDFFNLVAFQRTADYMSKYCTKGSKVAIEGKLQARSWVDQASGQKRTSYEVVVDNIQSLSSRQEGAQPMANMDGGGGDDYAQSAPASSAPAPARSSAPTPTRTSRATPPPPADDDDADPFADE